MKQFGPNCFISAGKTSGNADLLSASFTCRLRADALTAVHFMTMKR